MDIDQEQGEPVAGLSRHRTEEEDARVTETHPTAGKVIRMEETVHAKWRTQFGLGDGEEVESDHSDDEDEDGNLFYLFASRLDWQVGCWAVQEGIGHKAFDRLFAIPGSSLGLAYYNIRGLHQTIDSIPPRAKWQSTYLAFDDTPDYKHELHYQNPLEAIQTLLGNPAHAQDIVYKPSKIFTDAAHSTRIYNEMWTGHWWHAVQDRLPERASVAPVIISTDKTQLTRFSASKSAYPVYLTLGNIPRAICRKSSQHACILIGYLSMDKILKEELSAREVSSRLMDEEELDQRLRTLPPCYGVHHFYKGWSALGQVEASSCHTCALLDFIYLAQYPTHDNDTLEYMQQALQDFHLHKEMFERFHIDFCKEGWYASNGRNKRPQMISWLTRREKNHACKGFKKDLITYLNTQLAHSHSRGQLRDMDLPFSHINIYHGFKFCLDSLGNDVDFDQMEEADIVKAQPPISHKAGHFDTVVVMDEPDCESTGLTGTRIGRLKVIFCLPQQVYGSIQPAWTKDPLAYVEWYAPLKPAAEDYHEMYTYAYQTLW
ncbi:hypothetical protein DFH29DRAFT_984553 [Suillus ampliporus]|nr:hypothetical protein DFH29DRAFT_984553 [Suillus ampliporus]